MRTVNNTLDIEGCRRNEVLRKEIHQRTKFEVSSWIINRPSGTSWNLSKSKRALGSLIAATTLLALSPLLILIALSIKLTSPGPILFTQDRTGFMGRRFKMYKFRTMILNAEQLKRNLDHLNHHSSKSPDFKAKNDPRITRVGYYLRKYSLDELPQLFNVLIGDMRLVGPRPTSFSAENYKSHHLSRLASVPGLTGLWQISGRSNIDFDGRVELDKEYIACQGPLLDLKILLLTPRAVLKGDGAY